MSILGYKDKHEYTNKNGVTSVVYLMDCMELLKQVPEKYFELAVVDPPYGINVGNMSYTQEENRPCKQKNGTILRVKKLRYKHGDWDKTPPNKEYFDRLFSASSEQIVWGINHFEIENIGQGLIKWNKCVPDGVSFSNYEYAYCSLLNSEVEFIYMWAGMCQGKNLSEPTTQQGNKKLNEKRIHPTHKPIKLYEWLFKNYAKPNDKILDTHLGSGSSRIAADKANLPFVGCELDEDYFYASVKRFNEYSAQQTIF